MDPVEESLISKYFKSDAALSKLVCEHRALNASVDTLHKRRFLSPQDSAQLKVLKVTKLRVREKIASRLQTLERMSETRGALHEKSAS